MHALRRQKLLALIADRFHGDRGALLKAADISKGRLSQLLDDTQPFGDVAARNLERRLRLEPGYFDTMDARTLHFALQFESLSPELKQRWEDLVRLLGSPPSSP